MLNHEVVSQQEWTAARKALLAREKEYTHQRDALMRERMALPWVKMEKHYVFDTTEGRKTLAELFDGRSQLIIYHFMLAPGWEAGCPGCSFLSDHIDGTLPHLNNHDVTYTAVSRAPLAEIEKYKKRMGWQFPWASSNGTGFNYDFHVSHHPEHLDSGEAVRNYTETSVRAQPKEDGTESPGMSAFYKDEDGTVYHTYSSYDRGLDELLGTMMILDRAPLGRNEKATMDFVKRHDEYEAAKKVASCCH
ncbi:DUF899 domain-containing protein [Silvibacterium acidisoli]|uniref:DUF899 domain-containing protein n=1 Tax=Acidobacteriaceae bacterium ZG23-2 TaxID=2883246 RepID=UPI00406C239C